jgi:hypothetical protein
MSRPAALRDAVRWLGDPVPRLDVHPQLAVLAALHATLSAAWHALLVAHPVLADDTAESADPELDAAARGLLPALDQLLLLLVHYRDAADARPLAAVDTSLPARPDDPVQIVFPFDGPCRCMAPPVDLPPPSPRPPPGVRIPAGWTPQEADRVRSFLEDVAAAILDQYSQDLTDLWATEALMGESPPDIGLDYTDDDIPW